MEKDRALNLLQNGLLPQVHGAYYEALKMAIDALKKEPCEDCISRNDTRIIHTYGLEEDIRCAMCTNPMANDRGCDGGCDVNKSMYKSVLDVIDRRLEALPSIQPEQRTGKWIESNDIDFYRCSECGCYWEKGMVENCNMDFCPNCGAKMEEVSE